ncbi:MAG: cytochrome c maturation protein CcmE [Anaerolineae bacterium]
MSKPLKLAIGAIIIIPALAHIVYIGATSSLTSYYLTVDELVAQGPSLHGEEVRLAGEVVPGSIEWEWSTSTLKFQLQDKESIPVIYQGLPPDTFRGGIAIIVEGRYEEKGYFRASALRPRCPHSYVPAL